ncbi:unnamed protein product [Acanthoscelides obtectus]|uniref:Uncharacterized protein n=1 Tax=Acanthoscelides obtectus TaxID=200917 RepID=A0A9P0PMZ1_ACAOB|nr:unnamed protein product [Acanthoscelides obtectus]CAK1652401.1 hypothetical protein AOBTE_LOCUS17815 [Acanthoscelides obtectus]
MKHISITQTSCSYNHRTETKASRNMRLFYTKYLPKLGKP